MKKCRELIAILVCARDIHVSSSYFDAVMSRSECDISRACGIHMVLLTWYCITGNGKECCSFYISQCRSVVPFNLQYELFIDIYREKQGFISLIPSSQNIVCRLDLEDNR